MSAPRSARFRWLASPPPSAAIEIGARRVTAVALSAAGGRPTIAAHATELLADGVVSPSLTTPNLTERTAVAAAVRRAVDGLGQRVRRVALVLPDGAAKVSLVRFDKPPERAADLEQLVRWQVKKSVPFPLEQAQLSWTRGPADASGAVEVVVAVARQDIVGEYEGACTAAGLQPGLVDLATFNIVNAVLAADAQAGGSARGEAPSASDASAPAVDDWLLVHVAPDSCSLAVVRHGALMLYRNRPADGEGSLADFVHQTAMYYEDRLGGRGVTRAFVTPRDLTRDAVDDVATLCRALEARGLHVAEVDVRAAASITDRITPSPDLLRALAAPVGLLLREQAS